jgi:hypothetical protein
VQAAGFLKRPTEDIDLFTVWERRGDFETAARAIVDAYLGRRSERGGRTPPRLLSPG